MYRQQIEDGLVYAFERAVESDEFPRPQQAQQLRLLADAAGAGAEILPHRLVLDGVPAEADAEEQPPARQHVDLGRLLGDQRRLPMRDRKSTRLNSSH